MKDLKNERREYSSKYFTENDLTAEPTELLSKWLKEAVECEKDPTAMVLSTCVNNVPASRVVLLKEIQNTDLIFFSNYMSKKGQEIALNPNVALNFFWPNLERQVRIVGKVSKIDARESDEYFNSRPFESRIGAIVSRQSSILSSRDELELEFETLKNGGSTIERPVHWGGYQVKISEIEFWQGRPSRLHDRFQYVLKGRNWIINRLYP